VFLKSQASKHRRGKYADLTNFESHQHHSNKPTTLESHQSNTSTTAAKQQHKHLPSTP
jgi:hypothetical protein